MMNYHCPKCNFQTFNCNLLLMHIKEHTREKILEELNNQQMDGNELSRKYTIIRSKGKKGFNLSFKRTDHKMPSSSPLSFKKAHQKPTNTGTLEKYSYYRDKVTGWLNNYSSSDAESVPKEQNHHQSEEREQLQQNNFQSEESDQDHSYQSDSSSMLTSTVSSSSCFSEFSCAFFPSDGDFADDEYENSSTEKSVSNSKRYFESLPYKLAIEKIINRTKYFNCGLCNFRAKNLTKLANHLNKIHGKKKIARQKMKKKPILCQNCNKKGSNKSQLNRRIKSQYPNPKVDIITIQNRTGAHPKYSKLQKWIIIKSVKINPKTESELANATSSLFSCTKCDFASLTLKRFKRHHRIVHPKWSKYD